MRAELVLLGKHMDMARRANRRLLVVSIYIFLSAMMAGLWRLDGWHRSGIYLIFTTMLMNRLFLGGYYFGGLIKPFNNKRPPFTDAANPLLWMLKGSEPEPQEADYRNDERETEQRDRAHYRAYQVLAMALAILWFLAQWRLNSPRTLAWMTAHVDVVLYGFATAACVAAITLPQAILLWTEPDMEPTD